MTSAYHVRCLGIAAVVTLTALLALWPGCDKSNSDRPPPDRQPASGPDRTQLDRSRPEAVARYFLAAIKAGHFKLAEQLVLPDDRRQFAASYATMRAGLPDQLEITCQPPQRADGTTTTTAHVANSIVAPQLQQIDGQWWVVWRGR